MTANATDWLESLSFSLFDDSRFAFSFDRNNPVPGVNKLSEAITRDFNLRRAAQRQAQQDAKLRRDALEGLHAKRGATQLALKWLKPVCYHAILSCIHFDVFEELQQRIGMHGRLRRGPGAEHTIFTRGLMGLFAHAKETPRIDGKRTDTKPPHACIDDKERSRMAADMWWAFRHYVEPAELLSFTRKYRSTTRSMSPNAVVPELKEQIAQRRAAFEFLGSDLEDFRTDYPSDVVALSQRYYESVEQVSRRKPQVGEKNDWQDDDDDWELGRTDSADWDDDDDDED